MSDKEFQKLSQYEQLLYLQGMNRAEKRKVAKKLKMKYAELLESLEFKIEDVTVEELPEGTKVKLKAEQILQQRNLNEKYREWVEANKDKVFTCEKDPTLPNDSKRVVFKEDENNPKWLFHVTDLELVM